MAEGTTPRQRLNFVRLRETSRSRSRQVLVATRSRLSWSRATHSSRTYEYATQYFELTTLKQVVKWFIDEGRLPQSARIRLPLTKPQGTSAYCWTMEEVTVILDFCRSKPELGWLANVVMMLAMTGLRISELANLTWANIAPDFRTIHLYDESTRGRRVAGSKLRQTTKGKRDRSLPIRDEIRGMLVALPRSKAPAILTAWTRARTRTEHRAAVSRARIKGRGALSAESAAS